VVGSLGGTSDGKESNDAESDGEIDRIRKERARADADATKTTIFSGTNNNLLQLFEVATKLLSFSFWCVPFFLHSVQMALRGIKREGEKRAEHQNKKI
jgi:hypothetical protein